MGKELMAAYTELASLPKTGQATYDGHVKRFSGWLLTNNKPANREAIADYLTLLAKDKSASTINNYKQAIKKSLSLQARSLDDKARLDAMFSDMKVAKADKKVSSLKIISKDDTKEILANLNGVYTLAYKALAQTGLRISELINIKNKNCQITKEAVAIKVLGKGKKERTVFFSHELYTQIKAVCKNDAYLFCGARGGKLYRQNVLLQFSQAGVEAGVHVSPHKLRHTFATTQIKAKGTVKAVSLYLGHASTAVTETMYVHDQLTAKQALQFAV